MARQYTKTHEWVEKEGDLYRVGITDHAQEQLGDLVFINLPNVDDEVKSGEALADVESVKAVSDILSPFTGRVAEVNEALADAPETINAQPYEAWIAKLADVSESVDLMDEAAYAQFVQEEA